MEISVVLPTYNPDPVRLNLALAALQGQTLERNFWELLLVDNNSDQNFANLIDLSWHSNARILKEAEQGLTHARKTGFENSKGDIIIMVDDDNILNKDYLENVMAIFSSSPLLGAVGGKSLPSFEAPAPSWLLEFYGNLALRDLGDQEISAAWENVYPSFAPIGAGMAIRRVALQSYLEKINDLKTLILDRTGSSLASGGDNDIVFEVLKSGWLVGYNPKLVLQHIIPQNRIKADYLGRLLHDTNRSWVELLDQHQLNPWPAIHPSTVLFRKAKAWLNYKAWLYPVNYIRWKGACGKYDGLSLIFKSQR